MEPKETNYEKPNYERLSEKLFNSWNESLKSGEAQKVAEEYLEDGELFGTVSGKIRRGWEEIQGYFEHFLKGKPVGEVLNREVVYISDSMFLDSGLYRFKLTKDGQEQIVDAKFTFVWRKDKDGNWKIKHHHSAAVEDNKDFNEQIDVSDLDNDNIEWGIKEKVGDNMILLTGFLKNDNEKTTKRFTYLIRENENENQEVVYRQVSKKPENDEV